METALIAMHNKVKAESTRRQEIARELARLEISNMYAGKVANAEAGVKKLKGGAAVYEQVVEKEGKHYLRAVTAVPVVMKKCVMCHENYKDVK